MPTLLDRVGSAGSRRPASNIYGHVLRSDREMRNLMRRIPAFLVRDNTHLSQHPWLPAARRTLAISAANKIIMIHRPVLFSLFFRIRYSHERVRPAIAAATTILREHEQAAPRGYDFDLDTVGVLHHCFYGPRLGTPTQDVALPTS